MIFVSLEIVLRAIAARIIFRESSKLNAEEPSWMQSHNESNYRFSEAAALLDQRLISNKSGSLPQWLDIRDGTGYARPSDLARKDGIEFLLELAKWYPQWLKFNREFSMRKSSAFSRWCPSPSGEDYLKDCPRMPDVTSVREIGFYLDDIAAFLDRLEVPHVLRGMGTEEVASTVATSDSKSQTAAEMTVHAGTQVVSSDENASSINSTMLRNTINRTGKRGRRSLIDKALQHAYISASEQRDDIEVIDIRDATDVVYAQLIKLAVECPEEFCPLFGYENGQVKFWQEGKKMTYQKRSLGAYITRLRLKKHAS